MAFSRSDFLFAGCANPVGIDPVFSHGDAAVLAARLPPSLPAVRTIFLLVEIGKLGFPHLGSSGRAFL